MKRPHVFDRHAECFNDLAVDLFCRTAQGLFADAQLCQLDTIKPSRVIDQRFVTNTYANTVSVIDIATRKVVATVPVGKGPNGISVSP